MQGALLGECPKDWPRDGLVRIAGLATTNRPSILPPTDPVTGLISVSSRRSPASRQVQSGPAGQLKGCGRFSLRRTRLSPIPVAVTASKLVHMLLMYALPSWVHL